jgi:hypothetical protein
VGLVVPIVPVSECVDVLEHRVEVRIEHIAQIEIFGGRCRHRHSRRARDGVALGLRIDPARADVFEARLGRGQIGNRRR